MADDPVDALFVLPPEEFIAARDELARELRTAGERDRAKEVLALRRPTVAAWAINQAVRADPDAYAALLDAGNALERAQRRALSGIRDTGLRDAARARRQHVVRLTERAVRLLEEAGRASASQRDEITATFNAVSADLDAQERVGAARLSRALEPPSSFGDIAGLAVTGPAEVETTQPAEDEATEPAESQVTEPVEDEPVIAEADREADQQQARRRAAEEAVAAARVHSEVARTAARKARHAADTAGRQAHDLAADAERAEREAHRLRQQAEGERKRAEALRKEAEQVADTAERRAREQEEAERTLRDLEASAEA